MAAMKRRDFITLLGGAAASWPLAARGQQADRVRRMGILVTWPETDAEGGSRISAFRQGLQALGWMDGRNLRIDIRWGADSPERARTLAAELLSVTPDLIIVGNPVPLAAVVQQSHSVPVLFLAMTDPVETGFVQSLAHPGGNITGFTNFETKMAGKWLGLLKEIAPTTSRAIVMRQTQTPGLLAMQRVIDDVAPSLGVHTMPSEVSNPEQIERAIGSFARDPNGGLIVLVGPILAHRALIIAQAARHRLPAIYPYRFYAEDGGLLSYGVDGTDIYRRGAEYANRILLGEKPADLPVQQPTKFELVINLKTAKALGLTVPVTLQLAADEVIE
jgi:putative tryptophan/tyrosine transport system substrate-binding protein